MQEIYLLTSFTQKLTLLILEKDNLISEVYNKDLESIFGEIKISSNTLDTKQRVESFDIDILFLDIDLFEKENPFIFVKKLREINPLLKVIIFSKNKENNETLLKCLDYRIQGFITISSDVQNLKKALINCIDSMLLELKNKFDTNHKITVENCLTYLKNKKNSIVKLVNHFKGVPILRDALLMEFKDNLIILKIDQIQMKTLKKDSHVVISSIHLGVEIFTFVEKIDFDNKLITLKYKNFINSYVHHRKEPRVEPIDGSSMIIEHSLKCLETKIINISMNYILCKVDNVLDDFKINSDFKIYINCMINEKLSNKKNYIFKTTATIKEIFSTVEGYKVLLSFSLNEADTIVLDRYISHRTKEIVLELKEMI